MPYSTPSRCRSQSPRLGQAHCRQRLASAWAAARGRPFSTSTSRPRAAWLWTPWAWSRAAPGSAPAPILSHTGSRSASRRPSGAERLGLPSAAPGTAGGRSRPASCSSVDQVFAPQPGVDGQRRAFAAGHRVDDRPGAAQGVARHEEPGVRGTPGEAVGLQALAGHREGGRAAAVLGGQDDRGLRGEGPRGRRFRRHAELEGHAFLAGGRRLRGRRQAWCRPAQRQIRR